MTRLARFVFRYRASRRTRRAARRRARGALSTACCRATRCPPRRRVNLRLYCIMSDEASVLSGTQNLSKPPRLKCHARFLPHKHPKPAQYRALHRYALANQRHIKHLCCTHTPPLFQFQHRLCASSPSKLRGTHCRGANLARRHAEPRTPAVRHVAARAGGGNPPARPFRRRARQLTLRQGKLRQHDTAAASRPRKDAAPREVTVALRRATAM